MSNKQLSSDPALVSTLEKLQATLDSQAPANLVRYHEKYEFHLVLEKEADLKLVAVGILNAIKEKGMHVYSVAGGRTPEGKIVVVVKGE